MIPRKLEISTGEADPATENVNKLLDVADKAARADLARRLHEEGRTCAMLGMAAMVDGHKEFSDLIKRWGDLMLAASRFLR